MLQNLTIDNKKTIGLFALFIIISAVFGINTSFLFALSVWGLMVIYSLNDLGKRLLLMGFLLTFFIFLIGGHFVYEYFGMELNYYFEDQYYVHSNLTIATSLIFIFIGVFSVERWIAYRKTKETTASRKLSRTEERPIEKSLAKESLAKDKLIEEGVAKESVAKESVAKESVAKEKPTKKWLIKEWLTNKWLPKEKDSVLLIRNLSQLFYFLSYGFYLYIILHRTLFILRTSYIDSYVGYDHNISFIVSSIGAMAPHFFYLFLATLPSKKQTYPVIALQLIYGVVSLFTGRRTEFMLIVLFVLFYFVFRHYYDKGKEVWLNKRILIGSLLAVPFLIIFMFLFHFFRNGMDIENLSIKDILFGFFQQQGFSSSLLRLSLFRQDLLRDDVYYSFYGLVKFTRTNSLIGLFYNPDYGFSYLKNSVEFAQNGNSLAHSLSYIALQSSYLQGRGVGSCYIAELFHDFGYWGISIGSTIYGVMIGAINFLWMRVKSYNVWVTAICFSLMEAFLKAPRWNFDIVFTELLSLGRWSAFLGLYICLLLLKNKQVNDFIENKWKRNIK